MPLICDFTTSRAGSRLTSTEEVMRIRPRSALIQSAYPCWGGPFMSKCRLGFVVILFAALSVSPRNAHAQTASTITGIVRDSSGGVLPGVTVEATSPQLIEKVRTIVTDDRGA